MTEKWKLLKEKAVCLYDDKDTAIIYTIVWTTNYLRRYNNYQYLDLIQMS